MNRGGKMETNMNENTPNGFERDAIRSIQNYLRHLSFHDAQIPTVPLDGIYDSETRKSVISFQKKYGLEPTGIVDRATWDKLKSEYDRSVALNSPPIRLDIFPRSPGGYSIGVGAESYFAVIIQHMLDELESVYLFPTLSFSGTYDDITAANIREFQTRNLISPTGEVDRETWDALALQYNFLEKQ